MKHQEKKYPMKPFAILTALGLDDHPTKKDDRELMATLECHGEKVEYVIWNQPQKAWKEYRAVLIRSPWDYFDGNLSSFLQTLRSIESINVPLLNSYSTIEWNSQKTYLKDLAKNGVATPPSLWLSSKELKDFPRLIRANGWSECVLKPTLSAGGFRTKRFKARPEEMDKVIQEYEQIDSAWLLQPFLEEIVTEGEWSFVFLNGKYSHTVLKKPARGNFLVQASHGGSLTKETPDSWMIKQAEEILKSTKQNALYARIDVVRQGTKLIVMEVEMIEPELFFRFGSDFAEKFYAALLERLR